MKRLRKNPFSFLLSGRYHDGFGRKFRKDAWPKKVSTDFISARRFFLSIHFLIVEKEILTTKFTLGFETIITINDDGLGVKL